MPKEKAARIAPGGLLISAEERVSERVRGGTG